MMSKNYLIVFLKYPEKGKVKTRLGEKFDNEFALNFYKICAEHTFNVCEEVIKENITPILFSSEKDNVENIKKWLDNNFDVFIQNGNDLGERMQNAFKDVFHLGGDKVVIIGTDLPDLSKKIVINAFKCLQNCDVVIGPSIDGGYYLLGMNNNYSELFNSISWSTNNVLKETINRIDKLNLKYKLLNTLEDIDTKKNLLNWLENKDSNNLKLKEKVRKEVQKFYERKN